MTYGQDYGQPGQYPQQSNGQPWPQDQPWQPQYDPRVHEQRIGAGQHGPQGQTWPPQAPQWQQPQYDPRLHQQMQGQYHPGQVQPYQQASPAPQQYGQPYPPQRPYGQPPVQVAPKSTGLAVLLGLLIPGVGCMYAGKAWLGVAILAAWLVSLVLMLFIIGWLLVPACWIASGVLGYTTAQAWNREHGIIS
jgi:TM2 domain-containing membrane protein YozV